MINVIKEFGRAFFLGVFIFIVINIINYVNGDAIVFNQSLITAFIYNQLYTIVIYLSNSFFIRYLFKTYGKKIRSFSIIWRFVLGSLLVTFISIFILNTFIWTVIKGVTFNESIQNQHWADYVGYMVIALIVSILFSAFFFYKTKQESKVKEQKVIAGRATAQFDALKNQLDPHFLFNSLNVLTSLIEENPKGAQKFTTSLSKVYRYVLEQKSKELVTVAEEITFAQTYIDLLRMRFEESIIFNVSEELLTEEAKVVPLSLQLLLENAVKHNQVSPNKPLEITITKADNYLVVTNNLQPKSVVKTSNGVGLLNIQQRYHLLTSRDVLINKEKKYFNVSIPMLTKQISKMAVQETYIQDKRYKRAKERVNAIKGFYGNLTAYLIVIPCLAWLNYQTTDFPWVVFPTLGWGFGILAHGMEAFGYNPLWGKRWEERKIREFMEKDI
ncbi:2TM domain-containing protein [Joostella atrarenae]|uniref:2TM domain-containing protein n=1 Tax=Joostella atrarenae TaxID=679257 RepID=A0ABS9J418_9FLAO|nr:2TM domain-containing protein [Joostella atrarenae]MCF8715173.1 2TM domain-containing protein [Joostella atrarenae]